MATDLEIEAAIKLLNKHFTHPECLPWFVCNNCNKLVAFKDPNYHGICEIPGCIEYCDDCTSYCEICNEKYLFECSCISL